MSDRTVEIAAGTDSTVAIPAQTDSTVAIPAQTDRGGAVSTSADTTVVTAVEADPAETVTLPGAEPVEADQTVVLPAARQRAATDPVDGDRTVVIPIESERTTRIPTMTSQADAEQIAAERTVVLRAASDRTVVVSGATAGTVGPRHEPGAVTSALTRPIPAPHKNPPVFVDATGRRRRWIRRLAIWLGVLGLAYTGLVGVSFAGAPIDPATVLPFLEPKQPARPTPSPAEQRVPGATPPASKAPNSPDAVRSTQRPG